MKDENVHYGNRYKMIGEHISKCKNDRKTSRHNFKHISKWFKYIFSDMADWKWLDNQHNSRSSKYRSQYRKILAKIAKKKEKNEYIKEIESELDSE